MDKNIFDLDMEVNKINGAQNAPQRVTSKFMCTPGTCNKTCKTNATLNTDCCGEITVQGTTGIPSVASCFCRTQLTC